MAGGGSNCAGLGEGFTQQGVDQGGLAGAGGSADHDGERAVHAGAAGQDVVVKLPGHRGDEGPGGGGFYRCGCGFASAAVPVLVKADFFGVDVQ